MLFMESKRTDLYILNKYIIQVIIIAENLLQETPGLLKKYDYENVIPVINELKEKV